MNFLLDTNVCIRAMKGDKQVCDNMRRSSPDDCAVSMVSVFELLSGVERCKDPTGEGLKVARFLDPLHMIPFDHDSAIHTARIRWQLEKCGQKIGPYDLQLAGQALALDLTLVTHNTREFSRVSDLKLEDWQKPSS